MVIEEDPGHCWFDKNKVVMGFVRDLHENCVANVSGLMYTIFPNEALYCIVKS